MAIICMRRAARALSSIDRLHRLCFHQDLVPVCEVAGLVRSWAVKAIGEGHFLFSKLFFEPIEKRVRIRPIRRIFL